MNVQLQMSLCSLSKLIAHSLTKINKANLVRARSLNLVLQMIANHIVANYHTKKKLMNRLILPRFLLMIKQEISVIDLVLHCNRSEHHLISSEGPGFVGEHVIYHSQLFKDTTVQHPAFSFPLRVDHLLVS